MTQTRSSQDRTYSLVCCLGADRGFGGERKVLNVLLCRGLRAQTKVATILVLPESGCQLGK